MIPTLPIWDHDVGAGSRPRMYATDLCNWPLGPYLSGNKTSDSTKELEFSLARRLFRALARRFPALQITVNWLRGQARFRAGQLFGLLSVPRWRSSIGSSLTALRSQMKRRSERRLTVGVDIASFWEPLTGIGWYLYRLLEHLGDRTDLRIRLYGPTSVVSSDLDQPVVDLPLGPALEFIERRVPDNFVLPAGWMTPLLRKLEPLLIAADGNDVLFAPNYFLPRRFDLSRGARVATIHDLGLKHFAWTLRRKTLDELEEKFEHAVFEAARLITVSEAIKDEMVAAGLGDADRITAVHHGPGQLAKVSAGTLPEGTPGRFVLHVGTLEPRKNISGLLDAWRRVREQLADPPALVLCGKFGWKSDEIRRGVERGQAQGWLLHLGYVADEELAALYRAAAAVAFPTLYEGFGLPAVEALWAGTPLVCSDLPVLREVTANAALFAPPHRPDLFARRMVQVLTDEELRTRLVEAGRQRVEELSWSRAADQTARVWARAAGIEPNETTEYDE